MLCKFCDELSIEHLLNLYITSGANSFEEFRQAPDSVWFVHHSSYADLILSAQEGCPLCRAIWSSCRQPTKIIGMSPAPSIDDALMQRRNSKQKWEDNVTMCLRPARYSSVSASIIDEPEHNSTEAAPVVAPTPTRAPTSAPSTTTTQVSNVAPASSSSSVQVPPPAALNVAPTTTLIQVASSSATPVAVVSSSASEAPVAESASTVASDSAAASSGSSTGECSSGSPCNGDITYYEAGLGACSETTDGETDLVVALPVGMMRRPFHEDHEIVLNSLHVRFGFENYATVDLKISRPREQSISVNNFIVGAYDIVQDLGADANFAIAKIWLATCQSRHHLTCSPIEPTALPDRVLDLGAVERPGILRLMQTRGAKGIYLTLSHCWGKSSSVLQTTTANLARMEEDIPFSTLPRTFQDAVIITRKLGFQYLWIDSLCIIQDSRKDWEAQAAVMGDIYEDSTLTIAAAGASNADIGMLNIYQHPNSVGIPVAVRVDAAKQSPRRALIRPIPIDEEGLEECLITTPLAGRGWALQERHLSRRVLYYGQRQVYWECRGARCASDGEEHNLSSIQRFLGASQAPKDIDSRGKLVWLRKLYMSWYTLLDQYCKRQLTEEADKLPALSGLAARFARLTGDRYVAGLWEGDFRRGLLWVAWWHTRPPPCKQYRAPSWSWAALDGRVRFIGHAHDMVVKDECDVKVLECDVELAGKDPFGCITSARLVLDGYTWPLVRVRAALLRAAPKSPDLSDCVFDTINTPSTKWIHKIMYDAPNKRFIFERHGRSFSDDSEEEEHESTVLTLLFICSTASTSTPSTSKNTQYLDGKADPGDQSPCALILRAVSEERSVYERVGFTGMGPGGPRRFSEAWSKRTLTLI